MLCSYMLHKAIKSVQPLSSLQWHSSKKYDNTEIHMEAQVTKQSDKKEERKNSDIFSDIILQSYSNQKQYDLGTKTDTQTNGIESRAHK